MNHPPSSPQEAAAAQPPIGVAVIGYGLAGAVFHAPLIASTPGLEVRAVVTGNPARQRQVKADFPDARIVSAAADLWAVAQDIAMVVVATPNRLHAEQTITALEHGHHVVVDKPMALSAAEAEGMIAAAARSGPLLTVFHNRRWASEFLLLRSLVDSGRLGGLFRFESRFERYRPDLKPDAWREQTSAEEGGGLLFDLGSHLIDEAMVLFGRPRSVYAELSRRRQGTKVDDDSFVALQFPDQANAHLWMSVVTPAVGPRIRAWGLNQALEVWGLDPQEAQLRAGGRPGMAGFGEAGPAQRAVLASDGAVSGEGATLPLPRGRYDQFYSLMAAAIRGQGPVPVEPGSAQDVISVIEAARASATAAAVVEPQYR